MDCALGQLPNEPTVNRAKGQLTGFGHLAHARHVVQQPLEFGARKVGVDQQASLGLNGLGQPPLTQGRAHRFSAPVLPHDGMVHGLAGFAVPDHGGFALVGDAYSPDVAGLEFGLGDGFPSCGQLGLPDDHGVVFHPAGPGVDLGQFLLGHGHHMPFGVKHDAA